MLCLTVLQYHRFDFFNLGSHQSLFLLSLIFIGHSSFFFLYLKITSSVFITLIEILLVLSQLVKFFKSILIYIFIKFVNWFTKMSKVVIISKKNFIAWLTRVFHSWGGKHGEGHGEHPPPILPFLLKTLYQNRWPHGAPPPLKNEFPHLKNNSPPNWKVKPPPRKSFLEKQLVTIYITWLITQVCCNRICWPLLKDIVSIQSVCWFGVVNQ